ncbi:uncharacterized protein [Onthophagus taurus]|uniref:uncharacterized protein n=1 Tax=Onthophagus taurus TaxID=166361 RepID=UPI0039BEBA3E
MDFVDDACVALLAVRHLRKKRRQRRYSVHPINRNRFTNGQFHTLHITLRENEDKFFAYYRMTPSTFDTLCNNVKNTVSKKNWNIMQRITVQERVAITLRFLATGNSFRSLAFEYRVGVSTVSNIIRETCCAVWNTMVNEFLAEPTEEQWKKISDDFFRNSNFPNCIGALDGKHIRIVKPPHSASLYYNYKHFFSIVLLGLVDSNYCFTAIDVGAYGKSGDSNVFKNSSLFKRIQSNTLNIPEDNIILQTKIKTPMVIVADDAFGCSKHVLRGYSRKNLSVRKRIFNYRLSRARRYVECAFGILANKWRIFHTAINLDPDFVTDVVKAACILHNFVIRKDNHGSHNNDEVQDFQFDNIEPIATGGGSNIALATREKFADYFVSSVGALSWQYDYI